MKKSVLFLVTIFTLSSVLVASAQELKIGTIFPKKSPWGKVMSAWAKVVKKKSKGKLKIKYFFNAQQGDEDILIAKIRSGQLDGAWVTHFGAAKAHKNILVLHMPGLCKGWVRFDKLRDAMIPEFHSAMNKEGFSILAHFDVGMVRRMSKGKAIRAVADLSGMKVGMLSYDSMAGTISSILGYTPVRRSFTRYLPSLQSGQINTITSGSLLATQLRWHSKFDHVNDDLVAMHSGVFIIRKKSLNDLPGDIREMLKKTAKKSGKILNKRIRKEDAKAFKIIKRRLKVEKLNHVEKEQWRSLYKKIRRKLGESVFTPQLVKKVENLCRVQRPSP